MPNLFYLFLCTCYFATLLRSFLPVRVRVRVRVRVCERSGQHVMSCQRRRCQCSSMEPSVTAPPSVDATQGAVDKLGFKPF